VRFAYADPPYPGQAKRLYGTASTLHRRGAAIHPDYAGEVDHVELIGRLTDEFPDGWALSTGERSLRELLWLAPADTRILAWCKPSPLWLPIHPQYAWEPVLLHGGRSIPKPPTHNWIRAAHPQGQAIIGSKPPEFSRWIFRCLGAQPEDELIDMFPGTGAVGREWDAYSAQGRLIA
jgi:hypothetical protein